jgi:hypothetical protein
MQFLKVIAITAYWVESSGDISGILPPVEIANNIYRKWGTVLLHLLQYSNIHAGWLREM